MEFYDVVRQRRSIRSYRPDPVPEESLKRIAEAVLCAPTACNRQPFRLILIKNREKRLAVGAGYKGAWLSEAPITAVMVGRESEAWRRLEGDSIVNVDAAIAMEHFVLAAAAEGLGTCWICAYNRAEVDRVLGLPAGESSVALSPLGYAAEGPRPFTRKSLNQIFEVIE